MISKCKQFNKMKNKLMKWRKKIKAFSLQLCYYQDILEKFNVLNLVKKEIFLPLQVLTSIFIYGIFLITVKIIVL
jgi:hypothetical protein